MKTALILIFTLATICSQTAVTAQYPFIRYDLNKIVLPQDSSSWVKFAKLLNEAKINKKGRFNIIHFGDSHIQGDYFTGQVRKNLFSYLEIKNASRGITLPYSVAGANGPDELFSKSQGIIERGSIRKPPEKYFPFTGYSITTSDSVCIITLKDTSNYRFNRVQVFHNPLVGQKLKLNMLKPVKIYEISESLTISEFICDNLQLELNLVINSSALHKFILYGFNLTNSVNEIQYNSVGINGASFETFLHFQDSQSLLFSLNPDCIVFSYGTNDAIKRNLDNLKLKEQITKCITIVRSANPNIPIIFTTPGDYLADKKNPNSRIAFVSKVIKEVAIENNCAYWDFYSIMGGDGSVRDWFNNQLVFKDWVHLSKKGYRLQGDLFFEALLKLKNLNN